MKILAGIVVLGLFAKSVAHLLFYTLVGVICSVVLIGGIRDLVIKKNKKEVC